MWKPTKKQHLTNKKYVDENGGSGSPLIITGVYDGESSLPTFEPIEPNLSVMDLIKALAVFFESGELVEAQTIAVVEKYGESSLILRSVNGRGLVYVPSTGAVTVYQ